MSPAITQGMGRGFALRIAPLILLPLLATTLNVWLSGRAETDRPENRRDALTVRWNPKMLQVLSFGNTPVTADWLWIRGMLDPSIAHVAKGEHADFFHYAQLMTDLDPANFTVYGAGSTYLTIVRDDNDGARELLHKGIGFMRNKLSSYPESFRENYWGYRWSLYMTLAYVQLFEFNDLNSASNAFSEASRLPNSPPYLQKLTDRLDRPGGKYEVGIRLVTFMIHQTDKEQTDAIAALEKKKLHLFIAQYRNELDMAFREFLARQPGYVNRSSITRKEMETLWARYRKEANVQSIDPWGGKLHLDSTGRVATTTPYDKVFGLD